MPENQDFAQELSLLKKTLSSRSQQRRKWAHNEGVQNYRLFNFEHNLPLSIDIYARKYLHVIIHETTYMPTREMIIEAIHQATGIQQDYIYLKIRRKAPGGENTLPKAAHSMILWTEEENILLKVNLSDYLDTGLFLDHRPARSSIAQLSLERDVLNLFCYTGSFSVFAALGGARSVCSMDISATYLDWAKENFSQNHLFGPQYQFECQDILAYLNEEPQKKYDIIILDPPIFSNSRKMTQTLNIERDYPFLINSCLKRLRAGGLIFFSTPLLRLNIKEEKIQGRIQEITKETIALDFQGPLPHRSWLIHPHQSKQKSAPVKKKKKLKS